MNRSVTKVIPLTARGPMSWDYSRAGAQWSEAEIEQLHRERIEGYTIREIAERHRRTCAGILAALDSLGWLTLRPDLAERSTARESSVRHA